MNWKKSWPLMCVLTAPLVQAHHGIANFDLNSDLEITGTVTKVDFINPHSWLYLDVSNTDGSVTPWRCELRGATVLRRSGWSREMFPAGIKVTINGSPDRRDSATCYTSTIRFPNGVSYNRYSQISTSDTSKLIEERPARQPNGDPNFAGDWAAEQLVMTDPRGVEGTLVPLSVSRQFEPGGVPGGGPAFPGARGTAISKAEDPVDAYWNRRPSALPLTDVGQKVIDGLDLSSGDNPRLRCAPTNILFDWYFEMDINRITQTPEEINMYYGSWGIERNIHLNLAEHPDDITPSVAGHSIGHWEGDTLVVDTIGFAPGILNADGRIPHSADLHVVERFTLDPETMALRRSYAAEDPAYFIGQFTGGDTMLPSSLPYHGTTECEERTYREINAAGEESPWWRFWD